MEDQSVLYAKAHKKDFLEKLTAGKKRSKGNGKTAIFMAGSPGAGKTEVATSLANILEDMCIIDADIFRSQFPGYNGNNSDQFQRGAALVVEYALDYVLKKGYSFILDGTFAIKKASENIQRAVKRGYDTSIYYIYQDPIRAWSFTQLREQTEGRRVPKERFINAFFQSRENIKKVTEEFGYTIEIVVVLKDFENAISEIVEGVENIELVIPNHFTYEELEAKLNGDY